MKKGVVIAAACAAAVVAAGLLYWAFGRGDGGTGALTIESGQTVEVRTPAQRAEHAARRRVLWRQSSYVQVREAAEDGEPLAQRRLSEIYEDCIAYAGSMRQSLEILEQLGGVDATSRAAVAQIMRARRELCPQAVADLRKNKGLAQYWLHRSAKGGDPVSEMRFFSRDRPALTVNQVKYFIANARASGDADMIFEMSLVLAKLQGPWPDEEQAPAFAGEQAGQAWALAACRAGMDCASGSRLMNLICINMLTCSHADYERHLLASSVYLPSRPRVEALVKLIQTRILADAPTAP